MFVLDRDRLLILYSNGYAEPNSDEEIGLLVLDIGGASPSHVNVLTNRQGWLEHAGNGFAYNVLPIRPGSGNPDLLEYANVANG